MTEQPPSIGRMLFIGLMCVLVLVVVFGVALLANRGHAREYDVIRAPATGENPW